MLHRLLEIPLRLQWLSSVTGNYMQRRCNLTLLSHMLLRWTSGQDGQADKPLITSEGDALPPVLSPLAR